MKKTLLALMLALALTLPSCNEDEDDFEEACRLLRDVYSCEGVPMPTVVYLDLGEGLNGQYKGGSEIYINEDLEGLQRRSTLVHEFVHYMQVQVGNLKVPGPPQQICAAEAEAFALTDAWRDIHGMDRIGENWWKPYWYCWKWYASEGGMGVWIDKNGDVTVIY